MVCVRLVHISHLLSVYPQCVRTKVSSKTSCQISLRARVRQCNALARHVVAGRPWAWPQRGAGDNIAEQRGQRVTFEKSLGLSANTVPRPMVVTLVTSLVTRAGCSRGEVWGWDGVSGDEWGATV